MKIALDAKRAFRNRRGLGNYSRDVIRLMAQFAPSHRYVLCGQPTQDIVVPMQPGMEVCSPRGIWKLFPGLWRSWGVVRELKDVQIFHGLSAELPMGLRRRGIRSVVTVHDAIFIRYPELYSATYRWLFRHKVQYACDHADTIIAISEQTKQDIMRFFHAPESKIVVVYQGCHALFRQPVTLQQVASVRERFGLPECFVLTVGAVEKRKNLMGLIEAVADAQLGIPVVAVGGYTPYAHQVQERAKELGVNLMLLHGVDLQSLPAIYRAAQVMVYPSLFEGFGIPILEAMCVGTPVLTSTGSCFAETGGDAALYADPTDAQAMGQQLRRILTDGALREQMIQKGKQQSERFSDEAVARNLKTVYSQWV